MNNAGAAGKNLFPRPNHFLVTPFHHPNQQQPLLRHRFLVFCGRCVGHGIDILFVVFSCNQLTLSCVCVSNPLFTRNQSANPSYYTVGEGSPYPRLPARNSGVELLVHPIPVLPISPT